MTGKWLSQEKGVKTYTWIACNYGQTLIIPHKVIAIHAWIIIRIQNL